MKLHPSALCAIATIQLYACSSLPVKDLAVADPPIEPVDCSQEETLKSTLGETKSQIDFKNASSETVILRWINYEGEREEGADQIFLIKPGETIGRNTFLTHPFVVTDTSGNCLSIFLPEAEPNIALIK